jgi:hypothetical protein
MTFTGCEISTIEHTPSLPASRAELMSTTASVKRANSSRLNRPSFARTTYEPARIRCNAIGLRQSFLLWVLPFSLSPCPAFLEVKCGAQRERPRCGDLQTRSHRGVDKDQLIEHVLDIESKIQKFTNSVEHRRIDACKGR